MTYQQANELQSFGENIQVKVSVFPLVDDPNKFQITFRDFEYLDFVKAAHHLQSIQKMELPEELALYCY